MVTEIQFGRLQAQGPVTQQRLCEYQVHWPHLAEQADARLLEFKTKNIKWIRPKGTQSREGK